MDFDYIIIGGGTAGCVMAARLSRRAANRVLLVEAGRDVVPGAEPADVADTYAASYFNKGYMWPGLKAHWRTRATSPAINYDQARILGGGSSVMGMIALRGTPADYDEWERLGAAGWSWGEVEPVFRLLENDFDGDASQHGKTGPLPIRRIPFEQWPPLGKAAAEFAKARGLPFVRDMNTDFRDGLGLVPICSTPERRGTTATTYLDAAARHRVNLTIVTDATVDRILVEEGRARGITLRRAGESFTYWAGEIIVSAGAVHSPVLLMRSGIGDGAVLQGAGIPVAVERRGVGRNLQNHALLFIAVDLKFAGRQSRAVRPHPTAGLRFTTDPAPAGGSDMFMNVHSKSSWSRLGEQVANIAPILLKPTSRGRVTLQPGSDGPVPLIEFNFLDTAADRERLTKAFALASDFALSSFARPLYRTVFPIRFTDGLRRLNARNEANAWKAFAISGLFDAVPGLARLVFTSGSDGTHALRQLVADPDLFGRHLLENVAGMFHVAGTCVMGRGDDPDAVTDSAGRVHRVDGLRVVDASLMPSLPRGNTNIPTAMIAEKIAAQMLSAGPGG